METELQKTREIFGKICKYSGLDKCPGCGMTLDDFDKLVALVKFDLVYRIKKKISKYDWGEKQYIIEDLSESIINDLTK